MKLTLEQKIKENEMHLRDIVDFLNCLSNNIGSGEGDFLDSSDIININHYVSILEDILEDI